MIKFLLSLLEMMKTPIRLSEANDWAKLEFGRDVLKSDLDGRVL